MDTNPHQAALDRLDQGGREADESDEARHARYAHEDEIRKHEREEDERKAEQGRRDREEMRKQLQEMQAQHQDTPEKQLSDRLASHEAEMQKLRDRIAELETEKGGHAGEPLQITDEHKEG